MIDRLIAARARELVETQKEPTPDHVHESAYRALCESLPILLRTAGLTRAVTYLDAKKDLGNDDKPKNEYAFILAHMESQLEAAGIYNDQKGRKPNLSRYVVSGDLSTIAYTHVSKLAFRVAYWHKRMAQALLRRRDDDR